MWLRQSERREGGREGTGQLVQGLMGQGEDLGFDLQEDGDPKGLWAGHLTQVLMDALWRLQGECTEEESDGGRETNCTQLRLTFVLCPQGQ